MLKKSFTFAHFRSSCFASDQRSSERTLPSVFVALFLFVLLLPAVIIAARARGQVTVLVNASVIDLLFFRFYARPADDGQGLAAHHQNFRLYVVFLFHRSIRVDCYYPLLDKELPAVLYVQARRLGFRHPAALKVEELHLC